MWADNPVILKNYAKHYQNGSAMPQALLDKVIAASKFNQGFATTEYLGRRCWTRTGTRSARTRCRRPRT